MRLPVYIVYSSSWYSMRGKNAILCIRHFIYCCALLFLAKQESCSTLCQVLLQTNRSCRHSTNQSNASPESYVRPLPSTRRNMQYAVSACHVLQRGAHRAQRPRNRVTRQSKRNACNLLQLAYESRAKNTPNCGKMYSQEKQT